MLVDIVLGLVMLVIVALVVTAVCTLWARVPFVPTPTKTAAEMIKVADLKGNETVYDLGAGDGKLLLYAKRAHPGIRAIGYEIVPLVWLLGRLRMLFSRNKIELHLGNAFKADISDADCVFLYLITSLMPKVEKKFNRELKPGAKVISNAFKMPNKKPLKKLQVPGLLGKGVLYVYEW